MQSNRNFGVRRLDAAFFLWTARARHRFLWTAVTSRRLCFSPFFRAVSRTMKESGVKSPYSKKKKESGVKPPHSKTESHATREAAIPAIRLAKLLHRSGVSIIAQRAHYAARRLTMLGHRQTANHK